MISILNFIFDAHNNCVVVYTGLAKLKIILISGKFN